MDATAAWIKRRLTAGNFRLSIHAGERGNLRLVTEADIRHCGRTAMSIQFQDPRGTWRVIGLDCDGEKLNVICAVHEHLLIVTLF